MARRRGRGFVACPRLGLPLTMRMTGLSNRAGPAVQHDANDRSFKSGRPDASEAFFFEKGRGCRAREARNQPQPPSPAKFIVVLFSGSLWLRREARCPVQTP